MPQLNKKISEAFKEYIEEIGQVQQGIDNKILEILAEKSVKKTIEQISELVEEYNENVDKSTTELFRDTELAILKASTES